MKLSNDHQKGYIVLTSNITRHQEIIKCSPERLQNVGIECYITCATVKPTVGLALVHQLKQLDQQTITDKKSQGHKRKYIQ